MAHTMKVRPALARGLLKATRWKLSGSVPESGVMIGAPHTSRWDWVVMLMIVWANGKRPEVLIKHTYFRGPLGPILRATGGIPLNREDPGATIRAMLERAQAHESFMLVIAPEGIRGKGEYWKPGFYRVAKQTGLPIGLGFVDGPTRTLGMGPTFYPSDDIVADMDFIRAFYADKRGIIPSSRTEPRLREEETGLPT